MNVADIAQSLGYKPEDDSWDTDGRRTYIHDCDADLPVMRILRGIFERAGGWRLHPTELRTFIHESGEVVEIEPGGPDTSGHYLHHMRAAVIE